MAGRSRTSFQKRAREKKKQEKAAIKREVRSRRGDEERSSEPQVASVEDLEGYGLVNESDEEGSEQEG